MSLASAIAAKNHGLRKQLRMARINKKPEKVIEDALKNGLLMALTATLLLFFLFDKEDIPIIFLLFAFIVLFYMFYGFNLLHIKAAIIRRKKEIDKDVLFAGRYLLVKLNSGQPLINALNEASRSYGVANKYFKEIVKEIELGKPLEKAISEESEFSPSEKFRKILFQIANALKIGIDVTEFLEATLNEIAEQQIIEINRYGKKLNSITLFYMLFAIVLPSLGLTIFIVVFSLSGKVLDINFFGSVLFFLALIQVVFLSVYKSIRPNINI